MSTSQAIEIIRQSPEQAGGVLRAVLTGHAWLFEAGDSRLGRLPYLDVPRVFVEENVCVRTAVSAALGRLLNEVVHVSESSFGETAATNLLVVLQKCGAGLLPVMTKVVDSRILLEQKRVSLHAAVLKAIACHSHSLSPDFWIEQAQLVGSPYGAMIFSAIAKDDVDRAFQLLPLLVTDGASADKWVSYVPLVPPRLLNDKLSAVWSSLNTCVQETLESYATAYPQLVVTAEIADGWESEIETPQSLVALTLIHQMGGSAERMVRATSLRAHALLPNGGDEQGEHSFNSASLGTWEVLLSNFAFEDSTFLPKIGHGPSEFALAP